MDRVTTNIKNLEYYLAQKKSSKSNHFLMTSMVPKDV